MRRVTLWLVGTVAVLMLLFSYRTSTGGTVGTRPTALAPPRAATSSGATAPGTTESGDGTTGSGGTASGGTGAGGTGSRSTTSGTVTGSSVDTRWGPVQVQVTIKSGRITDVQAVVYPANNPRDEEINAYALPVLHDEVIAAQGAKIDAVGGATVTSEGYIGSLQSALDAAHLGS